MIFGFISGMALAVVTRVYIPFRHRRWPYTAQQAQWMQQVLLIPLEIPFKTPPRIVLPFVFFGWCSDEGRRMFKRIFKDNRQYIMLYCHSTFLLFYPLILYQHVRNSII
jgi:hypothetical protein